MAAVIPLFLSASKPLLIVLAAFQLFSAVDGGDPIVRQKRYVLHRTKWGRCSLTWAFRDPFNLFNTAEDYLVARQVIEGSVRTWERESDGLLRLVDFSSVAISSRRMPDIDIYFAQKAHGDGESFDGVGGMVAHSAYPPHGLVHFDASERWTVADGGRRKSKENEGDMDAANNTESKMVDLRYVALHEIGHALGLRHSAYNRSVMNQYYSENADGTLHLSRDDIAGIEELYGHCKRRKHKRHRRRKATSTVFSTPKNLAYLNSFKALI